MSTMLCDPRYAFTLRDLRSSALYRSESSKCNGDRVVLPLFAAAREGWREPSKFLRGGPRNRSHGARSLQQAELWRPPPREPSRRPHFRCAPALACFVLACVMGRWALACGGWPLPINLSYTLVAPSAYPPYFSILVCKSSRSFR